MARQKMAHVLRIPTPGDRLRSCAATTCNLRSATGSSRPLRVVASQRGFNNRPLAMTRWPKYVAAKSTCHRMKSSTWMVVCSWLRSGVELCTRNMISVGLAVQLCRRVSCRLKPGRGLPGLVCVEPFEKMAHSRRILACHSLWTYTCTSHATLYPHHKCWYSIRH